MGNSTERFTSTLSGPEPVRSIPIEDYVAHITGVDGLVREAAKALGQPAPTVKVRPPVLTDDGGFETEFGVDSGTDA